MFDQVDHRLSQLEDFKGSDFTEFWKREKTFIFFLLSFGRGRKRSFSSGRRERYREGAENTTTTITTTTTTTTTKEETAQYRGSMDIEQGM